MPNSHFIITNLDRRGFPVCARTHYMANPLIRSDRIPTHQCRPRSTLPKGHRCCCFSPVWTYSVNCSFPTWRRLTVEHCGGKMRGHPLNYPPSGWCWLAVVGSRSEWLYCSTSESINRTEEIITNFMDVISGLHLRTLILSTWASIVEESHHMRTNIAPICDNKFSKSQSV